MSAPPPDDPRAPEAHSAPETKAARATDTRDAEAPDPARRQLIAWLWRLPVVAALGGGAFGVYRGWQVHFVKPPAEEPEFEVRDPVRVAAAEAFAEPWSSVAFAYDGVPTVAVRLPEPIPGSIPVPDSGDAAAGASLAAFSRVCTHQGCIVELNRSPEAIALATNYRGDHPALVCGCHLSVFDPLRAGRAVAGPAQLPLGRVQLTLREEAVFAIGRETA